MLDGVYDAPTASVAPVPEPDVARPTAAPTEIDSDSEDMILPWKRQRSELTASDDIVEPVEVIDLSPL